MNGVEEAFEKSCLSNLTLTEDYAIFSTYNDRIGAKVIDFGSSDDLILKYDLTESAINFTPNTEITALGSMLGDSWNVFDINHMVAIEHNDNGDLLLVDDVQFIYKHIL